MLAGWLDAILEKLPIAQFLIALKTEEEPGSIGRASRGCKNNRQGKAISERDLSHIWSFQRMPDTSRRRSHPNKRAVRGNFRCRYNAAMFTGIIEKTVQIIGTAQGPMFRRLTLAGGWSDIKLGDSIAINGVCLTVADLSDGGVIGFDVIKETLDRTNLGLIRQGDTVNVERALRAGDRLDGHFVQGHVDGTGLLKAQISTANEFRLVITAPDSLAKYLAPKGSVSIDGVSLTIAAVDGLQFEVALIPTTLKLTTLGNRPPNWSFNLEADIISKTIVHYLEQRGI